MSPSQFAALESIFSASGKIVSEGFERDGRQRIFIGSSSEGLRIARKIQELLAGEFSVIVWDQGGTSTLEALEAVVLQYHFGVFVFTPNDQLHSRGEKKPVARDNVLFELGMFIGKLGRRKSPNLNRISCFTLSSIVL
jgi:predicted nucleotide-binding protein